MPFEFPVIISPEAQEDLNEMGSLTRRLVAQALKDELRTPSPSLTVQGASEHGWLVLPIGNYRIHYRALGSEVEGGPGRFVERIVEERDEDSAASGGQEHSSAR